MTRIWILSLFVTFFTGQAWADSIEARYRSVLKPCGLYGDTEFRIQRCAKVNAEKTDFQGIKLRDALKVEKWALVTVLASADQSPMTFWKDLSKGGRVWSGQLSEPVGSLNRVEDACAAWPYEDGFFAREYFGLPSGEDWSQAYRSGINRVLELSSHWFWAWQVSEGMTQAIAVWFEGESVMHTTEIPTTYDGIGITGSLNQHGPGAIRCVH